MKIYKVVRHLFLKQTKKTTEHITDLHRHLKKKDNKTFPLIPPTDPRLLMRIVNFQMIC